MTEPQYDPKLKYRKAVQEIVQENQGKIDSILDRPYLDELSHNLGLSAEEIKIIETEILEPYRHYQQKLQRYKEVLLQTLKNNPVVTDQVRRKLERLQEVLGLSNEDIEEIEKPILNQKKAEYQEQQEEERIRQQTKETELLIEPTFVSIRETTTPLEERSGTSEVIALPELNKELQDFSFEVITIDEKGQEVKRESGQTQYFTEDLGNGVQLDLVYIPGDSFMMGSPEAEEPQHRVTVKPFYMGKYQVTQAQWKAIASRPKINRYLKSDLPKFKGDNLPVENVSWEEAIEFCRRLSLHTGREYRLPSEAEWEYACRAGTTTPFYFGKTITGKLANYNTSRTYANEPKGEYRKKTTPVGSFPPNAFGLYDMHGNVFEWCEDDYHEHYKGAPTDGSAWISGLSSEKVIRGGSWDFYPVVCRSAYRADFARAARDDNLGFRVVCVVPRTT